MELWRWGVSIAAQMLLCLVSLPHPSLCCAAVCMVVLQVYVSAVGQGESPQGEAPLADCTHTPCAVTSYDWGSLGSVSRTTVNIPSSDPQLCSGCVLIVGVLVQGSIASARVGSVDYFIVASSSLPEPSFVALPPGVPYLSTLTPGTFDYYRVVVPGSQANVSITLTPFVGTAELFVALNSSLAPPDQSHYNLYQWSAWGGSIVIQVGTKSWWLVSSSRSKVHALPPAHPVFRLCSRNRHLSSPSAPPRRPACAKCMLAC